MARGLRLAASVAVLAVVVSGAGGRATAGVRHAAVAPVPRASAVIPGKLIVGFRRGVSAHDRQQALDAAGAGTGTDLGTGRVQLAAVAPRAAPRAISLLEGNADVSYVEPDRTIHLDANPVPNDPQFKKEWGLNNTGQTVDFAAGTPGADIGAERAWGVTTGKKSVVVGVIDTGIDSAHPDLAANMWINPGENCPGCRNDGVDNDHNGYVDDWRGWDFINNDNNPADDNGHGTHVAGTVGAVGNNGTGVTGVDWNVQLMPLKFIGADGTGDVAGAVAALRYATAMGVHITNNSWGDTEYSQALYDAIADASAHGDLFVAAAGNDGVNSDTTPTYPADFNLPNIISVGASDSTDHLAYFSNYGQSSVDLAAPGVSIYSTWPGKAYRSESGTSMASPHVAGAAALALAAHPAATADTIKALLLRTVDHPAALAGTTASQGRLDAGNALTCANRPQLVIDAPGQGFVAAAGHPVSVRLLAGVCGELAGVTVTAAANGQPIALTAQGDGSYTGQFTPAPGSTSLTATATSSGGTDSGSVTGTSPSPIVIGGAPVTVASGAGEDQLLAFDGSAGTRVSALLSASTITSSTVTISNPDGSLAASKTLSTGSAFIDSLTLQQSGSYVVRVHPLQAGGGSMTIQLFNVPSDATAAISPGGPAVTLTTTVSGQNAVASFTGTAGRRVALATSSSISFLKTIIIGPGGTQLAGPLYTSAGNGFIDTVTLPSDGTYTIMADPQDERTGPVTLTLYDVPADVTSTISPGGPPASATTTAAGQNALFAFSGVAGRRVSLGVSSSYRLLKTSILNPDGTVLAGPGYTGAGSSFVDAATLKQTGTYTVVADPQDVGTGSVSYTLYDVPADPTAATSVAAPPVTLTTTVPGQNASVMFTGAAGQSVSVSYSTSGMAATSVTLVAPSGATIAYGSGGFIDAIALPAPGTYTVRIDPQGAAVGSATVQVLGVPVDLTGSIAVGGAPLTLSLGGGQNAGITFAGAAGTRLSMAVSGSGLPQTRLDIRAPDGSTFATFYVSSSGGFLDTRMLPATGTYTIVIDPSGGLPVTMTLTAYSVPADASATTTPGGAVASIPITVPGQNGLVSFAGVAGERVSFRLTTAMSVRFTVSKPDSTTLFSTMAPGNTFVDVTTLPVSGSYTIAVDPFDASVGPLSVTVYDVPPDAAGSITQGGPGYTAAMSAPGQGAAVTFTATAGQSLVLNLSAVSVPIMRVSVLRPDGTALLSPSWVLGSTSFGLTAPVAGAYTIVLDPYNDYTGSATVSLS
ncbi:MAG: S8 family serine peptidase [Gaiellales bacterium]